MSTPLSFEAITASVNGKPVHLDVNVPELGGVVRLKRLGAAAAIALGRKHAKMQKSGDGSPIEEALVEFMVLVLVNSIVDDKDQAVFLSEEGKAIVRRFPLSVLNHLGEQAMGLNELTAGDKPLEDREKN